MVAMGVMVCNQNEIAVVVIDLIISGTVWSTNNRWLPYLVNIEPSSNRTKRQNNVLKKKTEKLDGCRALSKANPRLVSQKTFLQRAPYDRR